MPALVWQMTARQWIEAYGGVWSLDGAIDAVVDYLDYGRLMTGQAPLSEEERKFWRARVITRWTEAMGKQ